MKARVLMATVSLSLAGLAGVSGATLLSSAAGAQGTMSCPNFNDSDVGAVDPGMTGYLVVGTSIDNNVTMSKLTGSYTLNGTMTQFSADGVQNGQGSFHYIFQLPQGAQITSWQVGGATDNTVITVSGCLNGSEVPTTPSVPGETVTPSGPAVAPSGAEVGPTVVAGESATRPSAATAVVGAARFTG